MSEPFKVTKIEFDKPILICENERLIVVFKNTPEGLVCNCVHVDADGKQTIVGENVEEVVVPGDSLRDSSPLPNEQRETDSDSSTS